MGIDTIVAMSGVEVARSSLANGWVVLSVKGEIDLATISDLEEAIEHVAKEDVGGLVIDLAPTAFMDSTGLKALIDAHLRFGRDEREVVVAIGDGPISRLMDVSGVAETLRIVSKPEDATQH